MNSPHDGIHSGAPHQGIHGDGMEHASHSHAPAPLPFSDADIAGFRQEDVHAGKAVVLLMTGIFSLGVFLYILVALSTWPTVTVETNRTQITQ